MADPLAEFADLDAQEQAARDRIETVLHRSYTRPEFYPTYIAYYADMADARRARYQVLITMMSHPAVYRLGLLDRLVGDAAAVALLELQESEKHLAFHQRVEAEREQREAYVTYAPNLRAVAA